MFSAFLSAYSQFICGILFIVGLATRYGAVVMILNFIAALIIAHIGDTYPNMFPALMMLAAACFFLVHGPGKLSLIVCWRGEKMINEVEWLLGAPSNNSMHTSLRDAYLSLRFSRR